MTSFIKYILVLQLLLLTNISFAEVDTTLTIDANDFTDESSDVPFFDRKNKYKKIKKVRKSNSISPAGKLRLNSQSKRARKSMSRNHKNHIVHNKSIRQQQRKQKQFSKNISFHKIKKLNF
ncbi:MAG: hypothetical protein V4622_09030, partial [Bacteroidota bacterium]